MDKFQGMNQFLKDKLRAPTMTAHDAPDGGDVQLADAAQALADEAGDFNYTPPFPVPLMEPMKRGEGNRGLASETWLVNPPASLPAVGKLTTGENAEKGSQFPINSVRVDNMTSQWMYWPENGVFIPPFWYGRVFRFTGSRVQRVKFETPTGLTALAAAATEIARVVFSEEYWDEQSGGSIAGNIGASAGAPPTAVSIQDEATGLFAEVILPADALAAQDGAATVTQNEIFNGTTWDRARAVQLAPTNQTGLGMQQVGPYMWDDLSGVYVNMRGSRGITDTSNGQTILAVGQMAAAGGNPMTWQRARVPTVFKPLQGVAIGAGSTTTVWTPAAGLKPRLMGWIVDGNSSLVDANVSFFETNTSGTFMGNTGFIAGTGAASYVNFLGGGPIVSTSSAVIVAFSSQAATIWGTLFGTEE